MPILIRRAVRRRVQRRRHRTFAHACMYLPTDFIYAGVLLFCAHAGASGVPIDRSPGDKTLFRRPAATPGGPWHVRLAVGRCILPVPTGRRALHVSTHGCRFHEPGREHTLGRQVAAVANNGGVRDVLAFAGPTWTSMRTNR